MLHTSLELAEYANNDPILSKLITALISGEDLDVALGRYISEAEPSIHFIIYIIRRPLYILATKYTIRY